MLFDRRYFEGKVAAVTGGASGVGLALCEELLESGAVMVVLVDVNSDNLAQEEKRLGEQYPGKVKGVLCNVTQEDDVKHMIEEVCAFGGGRLDLLINCAGASLIASFMDTSGTSAQGSATKTATNEAWKRGFALNFFGPLYGCRYAIPIMLKQGGGQVVNIISGITFAPMAYQCMYAATKAALHALTYSLRGEYAPYHIKFNSATPGTTITPMTISGGLSAQEGQTPHESAQHILTGVVNNDRLILGDAADAESAKYCYLPDACAQYLDELLLGFARKRRAGVRTYEVTDASSIDSAAIKAITDLVDADKSDIGALQKGIRNFLAQREADKIPEGYYSEKTAAITGGASGVGLALCEKMLQCGAKKVVLADCNRANLDMHTKRLNSLYPGKVKGVACNVADEESVKAMVASAATFFDGPFDILVNCADIGQQGLFTGTPNSDALLKAGHMQIETQERWEQVYAVNFYGPLYGCRAVLPVMIKQGFGQIVNIISGTGITGMPFQGICASTKAALNALTLALRYEFWDKGVQFNASTPGTTATAIFSGVETPSSAQTPEHSAMRILTGVARNERLIFGDDDDAIGAALCNNPELDAFWDAYFTNLVGEYGVNPI